MPLVGDIYGSNGTDLANESGSDNGTLSKRINDINEIPENEITLEQLLMNLANSGNEKHVKLASDLLNLNFVRTKGYSTDLLDPTQVESKNTIVKSNGLSRV